ILLAICFSLCIFTLSHGKPNFVFTRINAHADYRRDSPFVLFKKMAPISLLVVIVLGGIYGGFFTPTEAGGAGALAAFIIGAARREISPKIFWDVAIEAGKVTAAICFLLMAAQLYSQMLTLSGLPYAVGQWLQNSQLSFFVVLVGYLVVVLMMGCFLDSLSIMLILLPFVLPVIQAF